MAEGSERQGGRRADAAELERGGWNHATRGGAGTCAPQDGGGSAPFGGRDLVPPPASVRDRGVESGDGPHPACRPGRGARTCSFYEGLGEKYRAAVESVSMDMWRPYISATLAMIPDAVMKIAFDRFHVAKHLGDAVDKVRRAEHRALVKEGNGILVGTKWQWLKGPSRKTHAEKLAFARLRAGTGRPPRPGS